MAVTFDTSLSAGSGKDIIILNKAFRKGVLQGIPIALGYLSVSFGFGILAVRAGLSIPAAVAISITNVTSAGQAAGVGVIAAGGSYLEMALTQLTINFRYALMGFSLSQKLDEKFRLPQRMTTAFGITDEIFAVASFPAGNDLSGVPVRADRHCIPGLGTGDISGRCCRTDPAEVYH